MRTWPLLAVSAVIVVAVVLMVISDPGAALLPGLTPLMPLALLWMMRHRLQVVPLSPVWIIALLVAAIGSAGYYLADELAGLAGGSIRVFLTPEEKSGTVFVFAVSVLAFCVGAVIALAFSKKTSRVVFGAYEVSATARAWMLVVAIIPLLLILGSLGTDILDRSTYLAGGANKAVFGLGQQLATAAFALVGYVVAAGRGGQRLFALILTVAYVGVFFGLGSRRLALLPIVFVIGVLMARPTRIWLRLGVAGLISVLALPIPLFLRSLQEHGFTAYLADLGMYDVSDVDWLTTLNNVLIAFPITALSALRAPRMPLDYYFISINPISGDSAGWYDISSLLRLNVNTPFSTVGELWNYGALPAIVTWAAIGVLAVWFDRSVGRIWAARLPFVSLAIVGLSALFALQSLQYNLRASTRMLLYAALIAIAGLVFIRLRDGAREARERRVAVRPRARVLS